MRKLILLICLAAISAAAGAQNAEWWKNRSRVETDSLYSSILDDYREYNIYIPQNYDVNTDKHYPIVYLLHGMNDNHRGWYERGHLLDVMDLLTGSGEACEMIIVTPNAGGNIYAGDWNGYFNMPGWAYEDFFFKEFIPYIESRYRVISDKEHRAIAGLSMGGGGCTSYAQKHPEMFCAAYPMSALMMIPEQNAAAPARPGDKLDLLTRSVIENNCITFITNADEQTKEALRSVKWFVDCGDDDFLLDCNIGFFQAMRAAGIPCEFRIRNGGHIWEYWNDALYISLPFFTRCFRENR